MAIPRVDSYRFGQLVVDGVTFKQDVLLPDELAEVCAVGPEVLVVGQGASGLAVHRDRRTSPDLPDTKIRALIQKKKVQ